MGSDALGQARVKVRAFFGLPLPDPHLEALAGFLDECARRAPEFRWTPAANLHLTVRFLGHVELSLAEGIVDGLALAGPRAFDLQLGGLGSFKRGRMARVVWLGLARGGDEIGALAALAEALSVRAGLEAENRPYHAHLTLARARQREGAVLPDLPSPPALPPWRSAELLLYQSRMGRGGSAYEPLRRLSLG